ncbi:AP-2 complex subunit beta [Heterocephalus glaber]|uniref:AP complex subunit beta n=1 Tax=Heterocephalus glaber TaxID=10181 RepID=G5BWS7_HETGA|nr:AP-2 complex subunit beta [Heterocephalus glaber]
MVEEEDFIFYAMHMNKTFRRPETATPIGPHLQIRSRITTDSKYFTTNKKGEIFELKAELNNEKKEKRKEAVKKVIAAMTMGKDVSSLFPDVVNYMQTNNLELKKLVYLYLMNYAKSQPDMAIMAVNSFVKDCEDPKPLIRALAVRTMGHIHVDKITEYLCEPLRKCLKDEDPYVRKTVAVCMAKLHDINAQMVEDQGFLDSLQDLIADSNPMVVANAVAALSEIKVSSSLSGEPEVQYVALGNINLIVQKRPEILKQEIKVFFVKYNDPIYVKLEKLDIMIHLASQANIAQVLAELKEYATEVDVDFVRKAVRAIRQCAIKVEQSAERCVSTLLDLIQTKVNYVVQEAIVVIRDIFRKYPNKYESIIATLCENLDSLDEPDARAATICMVGEYAERIDNADELLEGFLEGFHDGMTAKEVVLAEKPLICEENNLIETTLLDELICHIGSLASVYHKSPNAFVEGSHGIHRKHFPIHHGRADAGDSPVGTTMATNLEQPQVIPSQGDLLGDLLNLGLGPPVNVPQVSSMQMGAVDLLGGGLDSLLGSDLGGGIGGSPAVGQSFIPSSVPATFAPSPTPALVSSGLNDLFELSTGIGMAPGGYVAPKAVWLPAVKAKGLEISGTFTHRQGHIYMEMNFTNKALQHMIDFAIQFNKNSFGIIPSTPLAIHH